MIVQLTEFTCDHCNRSTLRRGMEDPQGWFMVLREGKEWNLCSPDCVVNEFRKVTEPAF